MKRTYICYKCHRENEVEVQDDGNREYLIENLPANPSQQKEKKYVFVCSFCGVENIVEL